MCLLMSSMPVTGKHSNHPMCISLFCLFQYFQCVYKALLDTLINGFIPNRLFLLIYSEIIKEIVRQRIAEGYHAAMYQSAYVICEICVSMGIDKEHRDYMTEFLVR